MQETIDYALFKRQEKKTFERLVWLLLPFAAIFVYVMIRFALSGGEETIFTAQLTSTGVFEVAQDFVRPTLSGFDPKFATDGFEYGALPDSVYVIRSFVDTKNADDQEVETKFEIKMKFHGGLSTNPDNWEVVKLTKHEEE
jgi:hypothetical protein